VATDDVVCGLWTEHRIKSRDEGFADYRDSPPTSSLLCALGPGTMIVETSDNDDPCAHVLRYVGTYEETTAHLDAFHEMGDWEGWLACWKADVAKAAAGPTR